MLGNTDGKSCPGEHTCLTDTANGEIGGVYGRVQKRTLENYCHSESADLLTGKMRGCPLFPTKPENTPASLYGAIDTAEILKRYHQRGTLPPISELTAWEYCCFDSACEAAEVVENERMKEVMKGSGTNTKSMGEPEEEGGFSKW